MSTPFLFLHLLEEWKNESYFETQSINFVHFERVITNCYFALYNRDI